MGSAPQLIPRRRVFRQPLKLAFDGARRTRSRDAWHTHWVVTQTSSRELVFVCSDVCIASYSNSV